MWMLPDSLKCSPRYQCCFKGWGQPEFWHLTVRDPGEEASGPLSRKASKRQKNFSPLLILILIQFTYQPWYSAGYELLFWAVYWYDHHLRLGRRRSILQWQGHRPRFPGYKEIFVHQAKICYSPPEHNCQGEFCWYTHQFGSSAYRLCQGCPDQRWGSSFPEHRRSPSQLDNRSQNIHHRLSWWQLMSHAHLITVQRAFFNEVSGLQWLDYMEQIDVQCVWKIVCKNILASNFGFWMIERFVLRHWCSLKPTIALLKQK